MKNTYLQNRLHHHHSHNRHHLVNVRRLDDALHNDGVPRPLRGDGGASHGRRGDHSHLPCRHGDRGARARDVDDGRRGVPKSDALQFRVRFPRVGGAPGSALWSSRFVRY